MRGAWIEMVKWQPKHKHKKSRPVWARGLKLRQSTSCAAYSTSCPTRARGLKYVRPIEDAHDFWSRLHAGVIHRCDTQKREEYGLW